VTRTLPIVVALVACGPAAPPPQAPAPPTPPPASSACAASGDVLFEIDHQLGTNPVTPQTATMVYATGAWTSNDPKATTPTGCMQPAQLELVKHDVDSSTWQAVPNQGASCGAITLEQTVYKAHGKQVWMDAGCRKDHLDDASAKNLAQLVDILTMMTTGGPKKAF